MKVKCSFLVVTYNRCPFKKYEDNPLIQALISLAHNRRAADLLEEILVVVDGSNDYTLEALEWLETKIGVSLRVIAGKKRAGCSAARRKGIALLRTELFFMGDDDCLYSEWFLEKNLKAFRLAQSLDRKVSVIVPPIFEEDLTFKNTIANDLIGYIDYRNAWFDHHFDCLPLAKNQLKLMRIDTFKGVSLNSRKAFIDSGNFEVLTEWKNDYSEHLEISHRLSLNSRSFFYHYDADAACFHIKFGRKKQIKPGFDSSYWPGLSEPLSAIIERSNSYRQRTGCALDEQEFALNKIGSFLSFFLKIGPEAVIAHLYREWEKFVCNNSYLSGNNQSLSKPERIRLFKAAVSQALRFAQKQTGQTYSEDIKIIDEFYIRQDK